MFSRFEKLYSYFGRFGETSPKSDGRTELEKKMDRYGRKLDNADVALFVTDDHDYVVVYYRNSTPSAVGIGNNVSTALENCSDMVGKRK